MGNNVPKLTIYAPAPTTHRKCMMLDKIDDALSVFEELGIPGHEAAHHLTAFKAALMTVPTQET